MKRSIFLRSSLACAISAAVLFNAVPSMAAEDSAGTTNQTTPVDATQRDHNISQPNAFGEDPAQRSLENRTSSDDSHSTHGAVSVDGKRQIQISTSDNQLQSLDAKTLEDRKVVNLQNKTIGEVEEVVSGPNGAPALVVEAGGVMGIGEKEVLIPLDEVRLSGNQLIWQSQMDASQLKDSKQYSYDEDRYSSISDID
jgi:hypothetical protein